MHTNSTDYITNEGAWQKSLSNKQSYTPDIIADSNELKLWFAAILFPLMLLLNCAIETKELLTVDSEYNTRGMLWAL